MKTSRHEGAPFHRPGGSEMHDTRGNTRPQDLKGSRIPAGVTHLGGPWPRRRARSPSARPAVLTTRDLHDFMSSRLVLRDVPRRTSRATSPLGVSTYPPTSAVPPAASS